jgi:hypothetical protein
MSLILYPASVITIPVIYKVMRNQNIESIEFKEKFGELTEGLNTNGIGGKYWNLFILIRWQVTVVILVALRSYAYLQIHLLLITSALAQVYLI